MLHFGWFGQHCRHYIHHQPLVMSRASLRQQLFEYHLCCLVVSITALQAPVQHRLEAKVKREFIGLSQNFLVHQVLFPVFISWWVIFGNLVEQTLKNLPNLPIFALIKHLLDSVWVIHGKV